MTPRSAVRVPTTAPAAALIDAIGTGRAVVVHEPGIGTGEVLDDLLATSARPGVASASPVPVQAARAVARYPHHHASPPPPSLAIACDRLCVFDADALVSVATLLRPDGTVAQQHQRLSAVLTQHGWRHAAAPGVALSWDPAGDTVDAVAGWTAESVRSQVGPANAGLEAHRSWAAAQIEGVTVVVDGACLTDAPFTGTQHLVVEVTRWLAATRRSADVLLAVKSSQVDSVGRRLSDSDVHVVERNTGLTADVVYRPYQMLYARELPFVMSVGRRGLVGQLDMIGFANAYYHPSDQLFFFARNLQRYMMRSLDGVTFISQFGRESAFTECPDLDPGRMHVVSCGADPSPLEGSLGPGRELGAGRFLVCLSSTFWHKHRSHAIATFTRLVEHHGYSGDLVIGGPEPYFGRSTPIEDEMIAALRPEIGSRVHRWGHISDDEKWWLLRHADLVLYPSIVEGFGLVPFEAAAAGTPCLAYDGTAPGELLAGTTALVGSWLPAEWADRAAELIDGTDVAAENVTGIVESAARHTWQRCAERTWDAIDHALAAPRRSIHADDGHLLARISRDASVSRGGALRFDVARGLPAIRRRLGRAWHQRRARA